MQYKNPGDHPGFIVPIMAANIVASVHSGTMRSQDIVLHEGVTSC
jgi:hypothetical protein